MAETIQEFHAMNGSSNQEMSSSPKECLRGGSPVWNGQERLVPLLAMSKQYYDNLQSRTSTVERLISVL